MVFSISKSLWLPAVVLLVVVRMGTDHSTRRFFHGDAGTNTDPLLSPLVVQTAPQSTIIQTPPSDDSHIPLCRNDQITLGQWIPVTLDRPPYLPQSPRVRCLPTAAFYQPFSTWEWKPSARCQLESLTKETAPQIIRRLLKHQTLLFIGDSLTLEHYASLVHLLGDRARLPPKAVKHGRIQRHICADPSSSVDTSIEKDDACVDVVFYTDFFLQNITEALEPGTHTQNYFPTVVVLNRGAHYQPDDDLISSLQTHTLPALQQWNTQCATQQQHTCLLVWRTTVPGHPHCETFSQPATNGTEMQAWIHDKSTNDPTVYRKGEYHWQDFQRQNQLVQKLLDEQWKPALNYVQIEIMDSYATNILRPDNHRAHMGDCLHSCSPGGGSDLNSQWLLHLILLLQQQQNGQQL